MRIELQYHNNIPLGLPQKSKRTTEVARTAHEKLPQSPQGRICWLLLLRTHTIENETDTLPAEVSVSLTTRGLSSRVWSTGCSRLRWLFSYGYPNRMLSLFNPNGGRAVVSFHGIELGSHFNGYEYEQICSRLQGRDYEMDTRIQCPARSEEARIQRLSYNSAHRILRRLCSACFAPNGSNILWAH